MKKIRSCAILLFVLMTLANAQWLETTIYVPDSLHGIVCPLAFTYNATNNKIYVGGESGDCVIVIDGATNEKIARIPAGRVIRALCWNSTSNKVYCANGWSDDVTVIDGATNSVITTVTVGEDPWPLCWNSTNNKVYCGNSQSANVSIIDGATNSVITTITVGAGPQALCWNSTNNKVYCANYWSNNVTVIDGATNSVITTVTVGSRPMALCWNSVQNRTYVANCASSSVSVIRDSLVGVEDQLALNIQQPMFEIHPNPFRDKVHISFAIVHGAKSLELNIYNAAGRFVKSFSPPTTYTLLPTAVSWDGTDSANRKLPSGVYFVKFTLGNDYTETKKLLLIR